MRLLITAVLLVLVLAIGVTGGFYLALYLQNQIQILIGAAIVLAFLTWLGSGADLLGLLREWYKDLKEKERMPRLEYVPEIFRNDHPWHGKPIFKDSVIFATLKIKNVGGSLAEHCSGIVTIEKVTQVSIDGRHVELRCERIVEKEDSLNWLHWDIVSPSRPEKWDLVGKEIQATYANNRVVNIRQNGAEFLEVLFTLRDHPVAYTTTSRKITLDQNELYRVRVRIIGDNLSEEPHSFIVQFTAWDNPSIQAEADYLSGLRKES